IFYHRSFYDSIQQSRKEEWSRKVANLLIELYPGRIGEMSAQIAFLFESARDYPQAAHYFSLASQNAARLFAYTEAALLARRGLLRLKDSSATPPPLVELTLQLALGIPLGALHGHGHPEVQQTYNRARQLCSDLRDDPTVFRAFWGLWAYYISRLDL